MALNKDGLERFAAVAASHVGEDKVPGLVALVALGGDVHVEALGTLAVGGRPVERASLFRIALTTKPITAAATLALVREGLLELDEPVGRLLPELVNRRVLRRMDGPLDDTVPAEGPVTVRGLLTFTFGFGMVLEMFTAPEPWPVVAAAGKAGLATIGPPQPDDFVNPETWITRFGELPLLAQPGQRWLYNTGAHVLSVLCARAAGTSYEEVLRTRIFGPLGMRDTGFHTKNAGRLATAYAPAADGLVVWDPPDGQWSLAASVPRRCRRAGVHGRRPAGVRADAAARRRSGADRGPGPRDEQRPSDRRAARGRYGIPGRPRLGPRDIGRARGAMGGRDRLGRGARHIVPRAPGARPRRDRADPAAVRYRAGARRAHRPASRRPRRGRVIIACGLPRPINGRRERAPSHLVSGARERRLHASIQRSRMLLSISLLQGTRCGESA